jgi:hypothetical protein
VAACDPFTLDGLIAGGLQGGAKASLDRARLATAPATTAKLQLGLSSLPTFACLSEPRGQHRTTSHLLVGAQEPRAASGAMAALARAAAAARAGDAPCEPGDHPPIEFYFHSDADSTVRDAEGRHSAALFVQLAPAAPRRGALDPGAAGDPSPLAMIGTGKDEGAGLTPWRYVVERTGGEPPAAAAEGLGLGSMGAPSAAAWTDAEAAAFEAALDADGRLFLLWGVGGTAIRPKKKRKGEVTDDEAEEDKEGGERAAADGEKAAVDADGDAAMAPADGAVPSPDLPLEASPAPATLRGYMYPDTCMTRGSAA